MWYGHCLVDSGLRGWVARDKALRDVLVVMMLDGIAWPAAAVGWDNLLPFILQVSEEPPAMSKQQTGHSNISPGCHPGKDILMAKLTLCDGAQ